MFFVRFQYIIYLLFESRCFYQIVITLNTVSVVLKTFHDMTSIYFLPKKTNLWWTDHTYIRLDYNPEENIYMYVLHSS